MDERDLFCRGEGAERIANIGHALIENGDTVTIFADFRDDFYKKVYFKVQKNFSKMTLFFSATFYFG